MIFPVARSFQSPVTEDATFAKLFQRVLANGGYLQIEGPACLPAACKQLFSETLIDFREKRLAPYCGSAQEESDSMKAQAKYEEDLQKSVARPRKGLAPVPPEPLRALCTVDDENMSATIPGLREFLDKTFGSNTIENLALLFTSVRAPGPPSKHAALKPCPTLRQAAHEQWAPLFFYMNLNVPSNKSSGQLTVKLHPAHGAEWVKPKSQETVVELSRGQVIVYAPWLIQTYQHDYPGLVLWGCVQRSSGWLFNPDEVWYPDDASEDDSDYADEEIIVSPQQGDEATTRYKDLCDGKCRVAVPPPRKRARKPRSDRS